MLELYEANLMVNLSISKFGHAKTTFWDMSLVIPSWCQDQSSFKLSSANQQAGGDKIPWNVSKIM